MSELVQIDAKIVNKRSTVTTEVPTIPATEDHTDGTWDATDVYSGELFVNEADNKVFIRIGATVQEFGLIGGGIKRVNVTVPGGGQTVFNTPTEILGDFVLFEDGVITSRTINKTDTNELTSTSTIPEGTEVVIIY